MKSKIGTAWALGIAAIGDFFSEAFLAPGRWLSGTTAKRQRLGSKHKPNPEGYGLQHRRKGKAGKGRLRFRTAAPSFDDPQRLIARGNKHDFASGLIRIGGRLVEGTPYGDRLRNQIHFAGTKGNHGQTIARRLRREWERAPLAADAFFEGGTKRSRKEIAEEAKAIGVIL